MNNCHTAARGPARGISYLAPLVSAPFAPRLRRGDDLIQIGKLRFLVQLIGRACRFTEQSCGIARAPLPELHRHAMPVTHPADAMTSRTQ
jgi:hypothetical protein